MMKIMTTFRDKTDGKYYYEPIKLILFSVMLRYLWQDNAYPSFLYDIYGSEGNSLDRERVNDILNKNNLWTAIRVIYANAT